jgi:hypothetical protein
VGIHQMLTVERVGEAMKNFENPAYSGNSAKWHTGKKCIEAGCPNPAGTAWSPYWCFDHNVERIKRIDAGFEKIAASFRDDSPAEPK